MNAFRLIYCSLLNTALVFALPLTLVLLQQSLTLEWTQ